jgi:hypothetical protein
MRPQGEEHMTKAEALRIIKLLSALESWAFSNPDSRRLPDYLVEDVGSAMEVLERVILEKNT